MRIPGAQAPGMRRRPATPPVRLPPSTSAVGAAAGGQRRCPRPRAVPGGSRRSGSTAAARQNVSGEPGRPATVPRSDHDLRSDETTR